MSVDPQQPAQAPSASSPPAPSTPPAQPPVDSPQQDASRGQIILYSVGNIEAGISNQFFSILQQVMIVTMHVNPLMLGLVVAVKTLISSVLDPLMAYVSDNTRSRWGRRRPYILVGGVTRMVLLCLMVMFFPRSDTYLGNRYMETDKQVKEAEQDLIKAQAVFREAYAPSPNAPTYTPMVLQDKIRAEIDRAKQVHARLPDTIAVLREVADSRDKLVAQVDASQPEAERVRAERAALAKRVRDQLTKAEGLLARADELPACGELVAAKVGGQELDPAAQQRITDHLATFKAEDDQRLKSRAAALAKPSDSFLDTFRKGWREFTDPANDVQRNLILFVFAGFMLYTALSAVQGVAYYALGIELCPSYDGRTRVVVYKSVVQKLIGLVGPWVPLFCFMTWFPYALDGLFWVAIISAAIGIPATILMVIFIREHTRLGHTPSKKRMGLWTSITATVRTLLFWRLFFVVKTIGLTWGVFMQFGAFINIYWVAGSALTGAWLGGLAQSIAWGTTFLALPLVNWACRRYQKHRVLQVAVVLMSFGAVLQWWTVTPKYPYLQLVMPFFTSVGIASFYVVTGTMMADLTDYDELQTGERREGMYSAVMSLMGKMVDAVVPVLAGVMLVVSGFDPALEFNQTDETILNMRLLYTFVPGGLMLVAMVALWGYPLTRERLVEIKAEIKRRKDDESRKFQAVKPT